MTLQRHWPARVFTVRKPGQAPCVIADNGRDGWAFEALRIAFMCDRHGLTPDRAVMLAAFIWGGRHD